MPDVQAAPRGTFVESLMNPEAVFKAVERFGLPLVMLAAILHHIVQQPGNGLVLIPAVLQNQGAYPQKMRQIRHRRAFTHLPVMRIRDIIECLMEPRETMHGHSCNKAEGDDTTRPTGD